MFATRFISGRDVVSVFEVGSSEHDTTLAVEVQNHSLGTVCLPSWAVPSVGLVGEHVAVWAGTNLYVLSQKRYPRHLDLDDEVHAVYAVGSSMCIVGELTVRILDEDLREVERYEADDVLGRSWWDGDCLLVESAEAVLNFSVSPSRLIRKEG